MSQLSPRAAQVLAALVAEYIDTGEPVGSARLMQVAGLGVSSATIRNTLAELEDLGYLQQPHTSAGRIPTDRGYRFFITHLMRSRALTQREQHAIDEEVRNASEMEQVLQLSSSLLSKLSDQVGIVFMPTLLQFAIRSMDFILVAENKILCVIVGANGVVVNKVIETRFSFSRDELEKISRY